MYGTSKLKTIKASKANNYTALRFFVFFLFALISINISAQKLKVIAYNIEFAKSTTIHEMYSFLKTQKADVICLSEVPGQGWTKKLGELLGMKYSYEGKTASANHMEEYRDKTGDYFGKYKSILSKYPLENPHEIILKGDRWSPASTVAATVKVSKKKSVLVFSLHIPTGTDDPEKSKACFLAQVLKNNYSGYDRVILAGDFNDRYHSEPMKCLYDLGFKNPYSSLNIDLSHSCSLSRENNNGKVIDHILYKGLKVKKAGITEQRSLSDHKPVWALFKLK
jgi:endonuclease/exonuclease/phosphatase (EEP) superfamily protein YafD